MKRQMSSKILAVFLAMSMLFVMMPVTTINIDAASTEDVQDMSLALGRGFNMLGGKALDNSSLTSLPIFSDSMAFGENTVSATGAREVSTTSMITLIASMDAYLHNESQNIDASIGANAKILMMALELKGKYTSELNTSVSHNSSDELMSIEVLRTEKRYTLDITASAIDRLWKNNLFHRSFVEALLNSEPAYLFERYGTHIITEYLSGGEAYMTYRGTNLKDTYAADYNIDLDTTGSIASAKGDAVDFQAAVNASIAENGGSDNTTKFSSGKVIGGTGLTSASDGSLSSDSWDNEAINNWVETVAGNDVFINTDETQLLAIWDLLGDNPQYENRKVELENYFNEHVDKQYAEFYSDYIYSPTAAQDFTGYTFIKSAEDLNNIRQDLNGKYVLLSNIDLSGYENWAPIGDEASPFMGTFDGNGNTVTGLRITSAAGTGAGLFGHNEGTIKNLRVEGEINLEEADTSVVYAGGIAGYNAGSITNCYSGVDIDAAADIIVSEETEDTTSSSEGLSVPEGLFDQIDSEHENYYTYFPGNLSDKDKVVVDLRECNAYIDSSLYVSAVNALKIIGDPDVTYTGLCIQIGATYDNGVFYLELENVNLTGESGISPIYLRNNVSREAIYIISSGEKNCISAKGNNVAAIDLANTSLKITGDAMLILEGSDSHNSGQAGSTGYAGGTAISAKTVEIDVDNEVILRGGRGGNGVNGTDTTGMNGGNGGKGGSGITAEQLIVHNGIIRIFSGNGGNGAIGGSGTNGADGYDRVGENGSNGYSGGQGGKGGDGGAAGSCYSYENGLLVNGTSSKVYFIEGITGNGGHGGRGGNGGIGGPGGTRTRVLMKNDDDSDPENDKHYPTKNAAIAAFEERFHSVWVASGGRGGDAGKGGDGGSGYIPGQGGASGNPGRGGTGEVVSVEVYYLDGALWGGDPAFAHSSTKTGSSGTRGNASTSGQAGKQKRYETEKVTLITNALQYTVFESQETDWLEAKNACSQKGMHLVTIGSPSEQELIESLLQYVELNNFYIGAHRAQEDLDQWAWENSEGIFQKDVTLGKYVDKDTLDIVHDNFLLGEPNNSQGIENCLSIQKTGQWNDISGNSTCGYIMEKRTAESQNTPNKHAVLSGGIAGYNTANGTIENCVAEANVSAAVNAENCGVSAYAGGIAGLNEGKITNSRFGSEDSEHSVSSSAISQSLNEFADSYAYLIGKTVGNGTLENSEAYGNVYAYAKSYNAMQTADKEELPEGAHKLTVGAYNGSDHKQYWNNSSMFEIQNVTDTDYIVNDAFNKNSVSAVYNGSPAVYTVRYNFYEAGTSTVTMTVKDKNAEYKRYLPVNVAPAVPDSLTVQNMPQTEFFIDDPFTYEGLTLKLLYNNGNFKLLSSKDYTVVSPDMGTAGNKTVTVKYAVSDTETLECTYDIVVSVIELSRLSIKQMPDKLADYMIGEAFDPTGMIVEAVYNNGEKVELDHSALNITPGTFASSGEQTVTIGYKGLSTSLTCTVAEMDVSELPHITAKNAATTPGATVQIPLVLSNNTGFAYLKLTLEYDESALTLDPVTNNAPGLTMAQGIKAISWDNTSNYTADGTLCTLPFKVSDSAAVGEYEIKVTVSECYDEDTDDVKLYGTTFTIKVIDFIHGDANGDGIVNGKDVIVLRRHLVDSSVEISAGADANGDGEINGKDVIILRRYLVGTAELGPNS